MDQPVNVVPMGMGEHDLGRRLGSDRPPPPRSGGSCSGVTSMRANGTFRAAAVSPVSTSRSTPRCSIAQQWIGNGSEKSPGMNRNSSWRRSPGLGKRKLCLTRTDPVVRTWIFILDGRAGSWAPRRITTSSPQPWAVSSGQDGVGWDRRRPLVGASTASHGCSGRWGSPQRRQIGHGAARRSAAAVASSAPIMRSPRLSWAVLLRWHPPRYIPARTVRLCTVGAH